MRSMYRGASGPFRGERDDADAAAGGVLPAMELVEIGRADPLTGMGAARAILGRDVGAFDVEAVDRMALGQRFAGGGEIPKAFQHFGGRSGDHRGVEAGDSGGELGAEGTGDLFVGSAGWL